MVNQYESVFAVWTKRVDHLVNLTSSYGAFTLSTYDYFEIIENCPAEHVQHYITHLMMKLTFLLDEAIALTNGQMVYPYQTQIYNAYIYADPNVHTSFASGNKQSSRITPDARLSCCSWEGLEFLNNNKLRVRCISFLKKFSKCNTEHRD